MSFPPVFSCQLWGLLCGGILGAVRTRQAAAELLAKNHLLEAAGLPHLPGAGHWELLSSSAPAWAGALFFGLSLGLGAGSTCGVWCRVTRELRGAAGRWLPFLLLGLPAAALAAGDLPLAVCLLAVAAGCLALPRLSTPHHTLGLHLALGAICAGGLVPWALAPEGPFTRLRDQVLFATPAGLAVDNFYYRWTLYPAEALKTLSARSQPVAATAPDLTGFQRERWCRDAARFGIHCVDAPAGAPGTDLAVVPQEPFVALVAGDTRLPWPPTTTEQQEVWRRLSDATDAARTLRRATGLALFVGCPLGLCWLLASATLHLASVLPTGLRRNVAATVLAALLGSGIGAAGMPDLQVTTLRAELTEIPPGTPDELARRLRSPQTVERFYAARAAGRLGPAAETALLDALGDPVINVRYAAAQSLGEVGGAAARTTLDELLQNPEEWYVKERAYSSLRRIGWPPR